MDSKALASDVSSHAEIQVSLQNLDEAIAETAEDSRMLLATKKTFQDFYKQMKSRQQLNVAVWMLSRRKSQETCGLNLNRRPNPAGRQR